MKISNSFDRIIPNTRKQASDWYKRNKTFKKKTVSQVILRKDLTIKRNRDEEFFSSREWRSVRYLAIVKLGRVCLACGSKDKLIHVDHIKPRSKFPELSLEISNLQILCEDCNIGKGNSDETDWRFI